MYTFGVVMCALIALFGGLAIACEIVFNKLVGPVEEDVEDWGLE